MVRKDDTTDAADGVRGTEETPLWPLPLHAAAVSNTTESVSAERSADCPEGPLATPELSHGRKPVRHHPIGSFPIGSSEGNRSDVALGVGSGNWLIPTRSDPDAAA